MSTWFIVLTIIFVVVSLAMVLIILVQRPQGGGLAGAFGGAGGSGTDTIFGGRVGDALTYMTVVAFVCYLSLAIALNLLDNIDPDAVGVPSPAATNTSQFPVGAIPATTTTTPTTTNTGIPAASPVSPQPVTAPTGGTSSDGP